VIRALLIAPGLALLQALAPSVALAQGAAGAVASAPAHATRALDIYRELIEINTVTATGDTGRAADAMAARLLAAGFAPADVQVFKPAPRKGNLVARLRGTGARRPMLLLAHLDVVEARREDWSTDPFRLVEQDGWFQARGAGDDKFMAAAFVANLIRYHEAGWRPARDIILVLETDEEILDGDALGIQWLLRHQRSLIDAEFALNEGGSVVLRGGRPLWNSVQTSEKVSVNYRLEVRNAGGHSAVPVPDNAIVRLSRAVARLGAHRFPVELTATTRAWLEQMAMIESGDVARDMRALLTDPTDALAAERLSAVPAWNAQLRTTCVATQLEGGHAINALPQRAAVHINCRLLPGTTPTSVEQALRQVLGDQGVTITQLGVATPSPPSPLDPALLSAIGEVSARFWPGAAILPTMSAGATDGSFLRNAGIPTYGHSGLAGEAGEGRAHGRDERIRVSAFHQGVEYLYQLVKRLAGKD
jgi:acetylornithine deacetylase/succinyl-diaminopimelate desuccinylase-like protein